MIGLRLMSAMGMLVMLALAWVCSVGRWQIRWRLVAAGLGLQLLLAVFIFKTEWGRQAALAAGTGVGVLQDASKMGTSLVFGPLADETRFGVIIFIAVTGTIVLISALMAALYHLGVMQRVVWLFAKVMQVVMGTSGSESLAAAVNIFVGQSESALFIRPYLEGMTPSEVMALMTIGMGTIASGVMVAYAGFLSSAGLPNAGGHLMAASVLSAPASLVIAKIMVPETQASETMGSVSLEAGHRDSNLADALCRGATEGLMMAFNIMANLIAFVALLYLLDSGLRGATRLAGLPDLTFEGALGWLLRPLAVVMGIAPRDASAVGALLGKRTILNEFVAYQDLAGLVKARSISLRSAIIAAYALCGFANLTSIAIQIGGIGTLAPSRRADLARFGFRAMIGGTLATFLSACLAGIFL